MIFKKDPSSEPDPSPDEPNEEAEDAFGFDSQEDLADSWDLANVLDFRGTNGQPLKAPLPTDWVDKVSWHAEYKINQKAKKKKAPKPAAES